MVKELVKILVLCWSGNDQIYQTIIILDVSMMAGFKMRISVKPVDLSKIDYPL